MPIVHIGAMMLAEVMNAIVANPGKVVPDEQTVQTVAQWPFVVATIVFGSVIVTLFWLLYRQMTRTLDEFKAQRNEDHKNTQLALDELRLGVVSMSNKLNENSEVIGEVETFIEEAQLVFNPETGRLAQIIDKCDGNKSELCIMHEEVKKLYEWHDVRGQDGVPVWYVRQSLESAIQELSGAIKQLNTNTISTANLLGQIQSDLGNFTRNTKDDIDELRTEVKNLKSTLGKK